MPGPASRPGPVAVVAALVGAELLALLATAGLGLARARSTGGAVVLDQTLVWRLRLTDLALWSGASYCRHPSLRDPFAPHADHPSALEHFPAGSLVPPRPLAPLADGDQGTVRLGGP